MVVIRFQITQRRIRTTHLELTVLIHLFILNNEEAMTAHYPVLSIKKSPKIHLLVPIKKWGCRILQHTVRAFPTIKYNITKKQANSGTAYQIWPKPCIRFVLPCSRKQAYAFSLYGVAVTKSIARFHS